MDTIPTDVLEKALSEFKNSRDEDIEHFLQEKAMLYETRKWCSTYVLVSEEALKANRAIKVEKQPPHSRDFSRELGGTK